MHDNACDIFYKANKDISIVSASAIKSTESSNFYNNAAKKKKSVNIQDLDLGKKLLSISNSEDLGSTPKKPRMMKRRYTIAADAILNRDKIDKVIISDYKCTTCGSFYKTKRTLSRHMQTNRHLNNSKNLKGMKSKLIKKNFLEGTGIIWRSVFWNSYFYKIQQIHSNSPNEE